VFSTAPTRGRAERSQGHRTKVGQKQERRSCTSTFGFRPDGRLALDQRQVASTALCCRTRDDRGVRLKCDSTSHACSCSRVCFEPRGPLGRIVDPQPHCELVVHDGR
jgi:hypothetical protein